MKTLLTAVLACGLGAGCGAPRYGFTETAWNDLDAEQRAELKVRARERIDQLLEADREHEFINKPINVWFGGRSNSY